MGVGPAPVFPPSAVIQVEPGEVRVRQTPVPILGSGSTAENRQQRPAPLVTADPQDVVKVHLNPPGKTGVYQFVYQFIDQPGIVLLQIPPPQLLEQA